MLAKNEGEVFRPLANFPPTVWGYSFAKFSLLDPEFESYTKEVEVLQQEVKYMLIQSTEKLTDKIEFINLLYHLGVSYHFENKIDEQLNDIFNVLPDLLAQNDYDLHTLAISFQVFRQYGYKMPCDVFNKFKDSDGGFDKTISSDVKGLLSLYEATFLSVHGEDILDEALAFTRQHLETLVAQSSPRLAEHIRNALLRPFYQGIERIKTRQYISFYEGDESRNETLLKFAKLDYNRLQFLYKQELALLSRQILFFHFLCNADAIDDVPEYMKVIYKGLLKLFDETESAGNGKMSSRTSYAKEKFKDVAKAYFVEAKWFNEGYVPSMKEYIENGLITSAYSVLPAASFIGMENIMGSKEYEWVESNPKAVIASKLICRLMDDITTREQKRGHCASSVECYMKEHGVSEMEAIAEIQKMCANAWKDMNEECMKPTAVPRVLLKYYVNLARVIDFVYKNLNHTLKEWKYSNKSWWKDINLAEKLPYIRDRIVEVYLWAVAAHFEPEYTLARLMITKYTKMLSVVDDTYDAYGTIDELRRFTDAFQRCNADAIDEVPEYMKVIYKGLLNLFDETESAGNEEMSSRTSYAKEKFKEIARGYFVEAKWFNEGYVPSMEEYIENGLITSTYSVIPAASFIGMENVMGTKEYEWVENNPKTVIACKLICRLMDDITTREDERKRGHCASSVECYMKEHGVSEMEAIAEIQRMCANAWKDMNEECMKPTAVPRVLLKYYVNLARVIDFVYKYMDSYTYCSSLKEDVYSLFLGPLPM
ncbi:hypothetical protein GH714_023039 [Hevea brasiliensis]|uniref:Uncharacterized protein n=1 Tax=Hevea brasiliensis TaxID=3981 RepID=A0A6A6LAS9_HEVBR|nr:hypothetical protein GH714_023039 [Hevea brasiliensis]